MKNLLRKGFSLIELMVVVSVVTVLALSVAGWLSKVKDNANTVHCVSNLRTIVTGTLAWVSDRNGYIWSPEELGYSRFRMVNDSLGVPEMLREYVPNQKVWICPAGESSVRKFGNHYAWLPSHEYASAPILAIRNPVKTAIYYDAFIYSLPTMFERFEPNANSMGPVALKSKFQVRPHVNNTKANWAYLDGHIETR